MRWLVLLLVASMAMGAEITNTLTFTNKAGDVFVNPKLIRAQDGKALVIGGTVGGWVAIEELPVPLQVKALEFKSPESDLAPKLETKFYPGVENELDHETLEIRDSVDFWATNGTAEVWVVLYRVRPARGAPHFMIGAVLSIGALEKLSDVALIAGTNRFFFADKPSLHFEDHRWEGTYSLFPTPIQMISIAEAEALELRFLGGIEDFVFRRRQTAAIKSFAELCRDTRGAITFGAGPAPRAKPMIEAIDPAMRVIERHDDYVTYSWRFTARNNSSGARTEWFTVRFLDAAGFQVEDAFAKVSIPAASSVPVTGSRFLRAQVADQIKKISIQPH